jgi:cyclopropane-fatty-acyl-phospholipid synthase
MGKYFFTGGQMPSADTLPQFQDDLSLVQQWSVPGYHYQKTAQAWLDNLDRNRHAVYALFCEVYGSDQADVWIQRWRMFFMSCEELFGYRHGKEWLVFHYLFAKPR